MTRRLARRASMVICSAAVLALAGCAARDFQTPGPLYRCEHGIDFRVKFIDDTAVLDSGTGSDVLLRDAGGQGTQTFYSSARLKAEFGLGPTGREAIVRYPMLPLVARCVRD